MFESNELARILTGFGFHAKKFLQKLLSPSSAEFEQSYLIKDVASTKFVLFTFYNILKWCTVDKMG